MTNSPGKFIGRYEIREELGRGGMATVYRAFDPQVHREVAVKLLPRQFTHDSSFRGRFAREAKIVVALDHPAIVPVLDYGEEGDLPYLVMRLMSGGTLTDKLEVGPLPLVEIGRIFNRIAPALDAAHARNAIHRDLKPSNILFDQWDEPYLADFGIVKLTEGTISTVSQYSLGTPAYMSPEQIEGKTELDGRSDVYALGVILFEMLSGQRPYEANTPMGLMMQHVNEPIPDVRVRLADLPAESQRIINRAMAKKRDDRYATATALATDVAYLTGLTPPPALPRLPKPLTQPAKLVTASPPEPATHLPFEPTQVMAPNKPTPAPQTDQSTPVPRKLPSWAFGLGGLGIVGLIIVILLIIISPPLPPSPPSPIPTPPNVADEFELPFPGSDVWDEFAPFPLPSSGFPLLSDRLSISPENVANLIEWAQYSRGRIKDIEYSPDGQWIAAAAPEGVYLYEANNLALVWFQEALDAHIAFHPDGQILAVGNNGDVQLWDLATGQIQLTLVDNGEHAGNLLTYSSDGDYLAATHSVGAQIWSADGTFLKALEGNGNRIYGLAFSPDNTHLAAASQGIIIWDLDSGSINQTLSEGDTSFADIFYLNDTTLVVADPDTDIFLGDVTKGTLKQALTETIKTFGALAVSTDGLLATGIWEKIYLWREGDTEPRYILPSEGGNIANLAFSPDGTTLIAGSENHIARWRVDREPPEAVDFLAAHIGLSDVAFAPDGKTLATTTSNGICYVWETQTGSLLYTLTKDRYDTVGLTYTPDGDVAIASFSNGLQMWSLANSGQLQFAAPASDGKPYRTVTEVAVSPDNQWLAAAQYDGTIFIVDRHTGEIKQTLSGHTDEVRAVTFFPRDDITLLASAGDDGLVNLWQFDGEEFVALATYQDATGRINALASEGTYLAAGDENGTIWFYYLETTADADSALSGQMSVNGGVDSLAYSPGDGQLLAASTTNIKVEIIYLAEVRTIQTLPWGGDLAFSPDGTLLAAASGTGLRVWAVTP